MNILVIGGTKFFGIPMVNALLKKGHKVTVATRGNTKFSFDGTVEQIIFDKNDPKSVAAALGKKEFDLTIDKIAYSSNDVRSLLQNAPCKKYIQMSTCAVYKKIHTDTKEEEFDAASHPLKWTDRLDDYAETKRLAERAALEFLPASDCAFVRYPVVLGPNDYTGRLRFYLEHIKEQKPMFIDDMEMDSPFIHETEAGEFIAHLAENFAPGPFNGCSNGTVKISKIVSYMEEKLGKKAVLEKSGEPAPYNGLPANRSINTQKAQATGFKFYDLESWLYKLIDLELSR